MKRTLMRRYQSGRAVTFPWGNGKAQNRLAEMGRVVNEREENFELRCAS